MATHRIYGREYQGRQWWLALCNSCGLHFTDPKPTADDIATFYGGDYHSDLRADSATERSFGDKYRRYSDWLTTFVRSGAFLDVGCATGLLVKMMKDRGFEASGLEYNENSAAWGRQHYGVQIGNGGLEQMEGRQALFDAISLTDVLEHTVHPPAALTLVHRLLRPSGHALITFPDIRSLSSRYFRFLSVVTGRGYLWRTCHIPAHTWEFSYRTATRLFDECGFDVVGFRRFEVGESQSGLVGLLSLPGLLPSLPGVRDYLGNQMEFVLRRREVS